MQIVRHTLKSYVAMVKGSVGSNAYRHFYATIDGEERDTMQDGKVACAFFVSSILAIFGVFEFPCFTVGTLEQWLIDKGWRKVDAPEAGDVLVYAVSSQGGEEHAHIGIYVGDEKAVSTSWQAKTTIEHDWLYRDSTPRKVTAIYRGVHLLPDTTKIVE